MTNTSTPHQVGDTFTDRLGTWVITYVSSDGSGFESEIVR